VPSGEWAKDAIGGMVDRVARIRSNVTVHKAAVRKFDGEAGDFTATLSTANVDAGAAILATGFTHFDSVNKPEWGFGTYEDVVTTTQVEQMISSGRASLPVRRARAERVAILLCVGSRDRQIGREWCSKICCTVSANLAMEIREELPEDHVYIYYMDIRTFGLYEDQVLLEAARKSSRSSTSRRASPRSPPTASACWSRARTRWSSARSRSRSTWSCTRSAWIPNVDNMTISAMFGVELEPHGYIAKATSYADMSGTSRPGRVRGRRRDRPGDDRRFDRAGPVGGDGGAPSSGALLQIEQQGGGSGRPGARPLGPPVEARLRAPGRCGRADKAGVERYVTALALKAALFEETFGGLAM
jgi:heterodisulfide reductase subunit A2